MEIATKEQEYRQYKGRLFGPRPLIQKDYFYVMISHKELDDLVSRLMHVVELDSDKEHRDALKGELKWRVRQWLDEEYREAGYENYSLVPGAQIIDIDSIAGKIHTGKDEGQNN